MSVLPNDARAARFPVSIKGVVVVGDRVVLLKNERDEWELPGGKLEPGEAVEACLTREIFEELGLRVTPRRLLDCWVYNIRGQVEVLIVTYGCEVTGGTDITISDEHCEVGLFGAGEIAPLTMPEGYKRSIATWAARS